ncbi:MAG: FxLYD domain-containing protein [Halanaeroarchaeum sp.]
MNRRRFIQVGGAVAAGAGLSGCGGPGSDEDDTDDGEADVRVSVVRNAPENPGPYEDPGGTVTPQESDALALDGVIFQRAGEKGLIVAGDATNTSDRPFASLSVEVTLYDENETGDELLDSVSTQTEHGSLDAGETWQWAATFDDQPEFEIDYYSVVATGSYG